jgi:hypothetical protein
MTRQQRDRQRQEARQKREALLERAERLLTQRVAAWREENVDFAVADVSDKDLAARIGISARTLVRWKQRPPIAAAIAAEHARNRAAHEERWQARLRALAEPTPPPRSRRAPEAAMKGQ